MAVTTRRVLLAAIALALACSSSDGGITPPPPGTAEFVVDVAGERFVLRVADSAAARLARERMLGGNIRFPAGPLRRGDGGFNQPWHWHFVPDRVQMVEGAIEVCDARPSYVEAHIDDFLLSYCPWGAEIISER